MADQSEGKKSYGRLRKVVLWGAGVALLVIAGLYLLLNVILSASQVTGRISRLLSETLQQPVTIGRISLAGRTISIYSLTIANPRGFTGGNLLTAGSIKVTPAWGEILAGRTSFSSIRIEGLKISSPL